MSRGEESVGAKWQIHESLRFTQVHPKTAWTSDCSAVKGGRVAKKASFYRGQRSSKGCKRVEAMLSPEAVRALKKLTSEGVPQTIAIQLAIIEAGKKKIG